MFCPICGLQSPTSSVTCPWHIKIIIDNHGNIISHQDSWEVWLRYHHITQTVIKAVAPIIIAKIFNL